MKESDTITPVILGDREIILVGTAHISQDSIEEVKKIIEEVKPDHVCVEIDASRYKTMSDGQNWENMKIDKVLKEGKGFLLLANLVLTSFQRKMGKNLGTTPGEDMKAAIEVSKEAGIPFSFSDREIQVTLRRAWSRSSFWNKNKMLAAMISSIFSKEELTEEEIEKLKEKSALQDMMEEMAKYLPSVKEVLIDERDQYLATNIFTAPGKKIVAVIGAGHANGIVQWLNDLHENKVSKDLSEINNIPDTSKIKKIIPWLIPIIIVGLMGFGFYRSGWNKGLEMFFYWFMVNGILSGIGALIALAHPLTIILSFIAAPFTSLNPTIGVGLVSGLFEGYIRRPRVSDFENLPEDILTIRGFFRNRFTHALVVFFFSSVGSSIGTFIAFPFLLNLIR